MKCGNQGSCEYYRKFVDSGENNFPIDSHDEIIEIYQTRPNKYTCRAIWGADCSTVRSINLLEEISFGGNN